MEIKIDPAAAATIASAAIFDSLTQEFRDSLIQQAVEHLLSPVDTSGHSFARDKKTILQAAFDQALRDTCFKLVREDIDNNEEVKNHIRDLLGPLVKGALEAEASTYAYGLSETIGSAIGQWLADQARKQ